MWFQRKRTDRFKRCSRVESYVLGLVLAFTSIPAFASCSSYDFDFNVGPSFIPSARIHVRVHHARTVTIEYGDRVEKIGLSESAVEKFCTRMRQVIAMVQSIDDRIGLDGIAVSGEWKLEGAPTYAFKFWSPDKKNQPRDLRSPMPCSHCSKRQCPPAN